MDKLSIEQITHMWQDAQDQAVTGLPAPVFFANAITALAARATPAQPQPSPSSVGAAIRALPLPEHIARAGEPNETGSLVTVWMNRTGTLPYDTKVYTESQVHSLLSEAAELAEQAQGPQDDYEFERGVIACLGVLKAHGYPHGSVIHDEIVEAADPSRIYAAAEDEDYEWAGLDPARKPGAPSIVQDGLKSEGA